MRPPAAGRPPRPAGAPGRLLVALGAFAAGLAAGLLLAPREGAATRRDLSERARAASTDARARVAAAAEPVAASLRERADALAARHLPLSGEWDVVDGEALLRDLREGRV